MKTKKLFSAILAATMCVSALSGCAVESTDTTNTKDVTNVTSEFAVVLDDYMPETLQGVQVYVHKKTRVMYIWVGVRCYGGGLTVMLDSEGKPLLYEGELE